MEYPVDLINDIGNVYDCVSNVETHLENLRTYIQRRQWTMLDLLQEFFQSRITKQESVVDLATFVSYVSTVLCETFVERIMHHQNESKIDRYILIPKDTAKCIQDQFDSFREVVLTYYTVDIIFEENRNLMVICNFQGFRDR